MGLAWHELSRETGFNSFLAGFFDQQKIYVEDVIRMDLSGTSLKGDTNGIVRALKVHTLY